MKRFALFAMFVGLLALPLAAQIPTGTLSGTVTDGKDALPGVSVTISSPNLQGTRTAITGASGGYIFKFVPAGDYHVKFELQGFTTLDTGCKVNAASEAKVDAVMPMTQVAEELTVTGTYETISSAGTATTTMEKSLIDTLPTPKNLQNIALLTAGVIANPGTQNAVQIGGAVSYENLIMVNGVQIQDNVRGTPTNLYIEDAVQETTTSVSSVSAEYGRFTGGVINMLTKSGGNEFHGSLRDTLTNDKWTAVSELQTAERNDKIINQYEATIGGFILKDRLWFFGSGRKINQDLSSQTYQTNLPYGTGFDEKRYEGKLTVAVTPNHRLVGSYLKNERADFGYGFRVSGYDYFDIDSIYDRETPSELWAGNYTGVLTDNFFVEGQYSKKSFTFINSGSLYTDIEKGTPIADLWNFSVGAFYNSPIFCGVCEGGQEERNNTDIVLKASYFLSSTSMGSHDIVLGFDRFEDKRLTNNYQSGSSYFLYADGEVGMDGTMPTDADGTPYPVLVSGSGASYWFWAPIFQISKGNNFRTDSIFLNDKWRFNNNFSFNIGVRYDKNHGENADGLVTTKDDNISPRLGITYDPTGSGTYQFNASYARYVAGIANTQGDASAAGGQPASLTYLYTGPDINTNCDPNNMTADTCDDAHATLRKVWAWWQSMSQDEKNELLVGAYIPGLNVRIPKSLDSPNTDEITVGASARIGSNGSIRADIVNRKFNSFYANRTDMSTGKMTDEYGNTYDVTFLENNDRLYSREYNGLHVSASYRFSDRFDIGGNYTLSTLKGNYTGETGGSGPTAAAVEHYKEYKAFAQHNPEGYLASDQRHRARLYAVYDILATKQLKLSVSLMETFNTGTPYQASAGVTIRPYVTNPGYSSPPSNVTYFFSRRGEYRYPSITRTDLALPFSFTLPVLGTDLQLFIEPRVTNLFNESGYVNANTTVYTSRNAGRGLVAFNPFTDKPIECPQGATADTCASMGANWQKGPNFGKPQTPTTASNTLGDYQLPRTYVLSFGLRF